MADTRSVAALEAAGVLRVEDGNHGEYRPRPHEFVAGGTPYIRAADMTSGTVDFTGAEGINDEALLRIRKGIGREQDSLLSHKGTVGKVAYVPPGSPPFVCSPQTTFWRSLDHQKLDPVYLNIALRSRVIQAQLDVMKSSTDMAPYVSLTQQRSLMLNVPPIGEQRAIAEVLGALDDKIAANERLTSVSDRLAETILKSAISSQRAPLASIAEVVMGSSPPGDTYNEAGEGLPFFQGVRDFGTRSPRIRVSTTSPVKLARQGDILVSVRAPVGEVNVAFADLCIGRGLAAVHPTTAQRWTLFHLLRGATEAWSPYQAEGTVFGSINRHQLAGLMLPTVARGEELRVEAELAAIEERLAAALAENETLSETRDALLPALMSGALRVKDAERLAEDLT